MTKETDAWCIQFEHYDPADEGRREALLALGNGLLVSRAAAPEAKDDGVHYPGTYQVGCYNVLTTCIQGQEVTNESIVNLPNWLPVSFRINGGSWFSLNEVTIHSYRQTLDMQQGLLSRLVHFSDRQGNKTLLQERRFISMARPHLMALSVDLTAENWTGSLEVCASLEGRILNNKVQRYTPFKKQHLKTLHTSTWAEKGMELLSRTTQSGITVALAAHTELYITGRDAPVNRNVKQEADYISMYLQVKLKAGEKATIEKTAALFTSRYSPEEKCSQSAREALRKAPGFKVLLSEHRCAWEQLWQRCLLSMDNQEQLRLCRLHIFQILQNFSPHTAALDAGVPPSGWQGEEYHGQVFWDELFVFPFLTFHFPDAARALLRYRYHRLDAARQQATKSGYRGAMFPWRSASDGHEETPPFQLNPLSGRWMEDHTCLQRHIGAIIAYNTCYYVHLTGDQQFLESAGAELLLEIARFWASISEYNTSLDRYEIHGIAGPDEYHTLHPVTKKPGLSNNTFTNLMAVWTLTQARVLFDRLSPERQQELHEKLGLSAEEFDLWETISRKMRIVFNDDGSLSQFEGFNRLKKLDLQTFREQHGQQRLDWALEKQGDSVEHYQVAKQADTPLLMYLFSPSELLDLFGRLGYSIDKDLLHQTITQQLTYTTHESSLSRVVYAGALASYDLAASWEFFRQAQQIDMSPDNKGTAEGIHLGAMGGTLAVLHNHYLRWKVQSDKLEVKPALPEAFGQVRLCLYFRGTELRYEFD